jgi:hypothetical protein
LRGILVSKQPILETSILEAPAFIVEKDRGPGAQEMFSFAQDQYRW